MIGRHSSKEAENLCCNHGGWGWLFDVPLWINILFPALKELEGPVLGAKCKIAHEKTWPRSTRWWLELQGSWKECGRKGSSSWEEKGERWTVRCSLEFKWCSLLLTLLQRLVCQVTFLGFSNSPGNCPLLRKNLSTYSFSSQEITVMLRVVRALRSVRQVFLLWIMILTV